MKTERSDLLVPSSEQLSLKKKAFAYPSWTLTERQICDLELLLNGGFAPLNGFLSKANYESVLENMRLADGSLWPIPITLDVTTEFSKELEVSDSITLRDKEGFALAVLTISDIWMPGMKAEARAVFGTMDDTHPGVHYLYYTSHPVYVGGDLQVISLPHHYDYQQNRHSPDQLKSIFLIIL